MRRSLKAASVLVALGTLSCTSASQDPAAGKFASADAGPGVDASAGGGPSADGSGGADVSAGDRAVRDSGASDSTASDAASVTESACGTAVPPAAEIVDSVGDVWTLTSGHQIARNGVVDPVTQQVVLLLYFKGVVYQNAYNLWWSWQSGAWQDTTDPRLDSSCTTEAGVDAGPPPGALGYMIGYGGADQTSAQIATGEALLGRVFDLATDGLSVDAFQFGPYSSSNGRPLAKVNIVEMLSLSWDANQSLQDMSQAASGAYDSVYTQMAQAMGSFGNPTISARIGHEMNGNWYPWSAVDGNTHNATPANYIATFQRIAQLIRKYSPGTLVEWCVSIQPAVPTWSGTSYTPLDYWVGAYDAVNNPGGADVISMDFYEGPSGSDFNNDIIGGQYGLSWLVGFAQHNHVKVALSEVATGLPSSVAEGNGCPCSNDGAFMQDIVNWIQGLPPGLFNHFIFSPWPPADDLLASGNSAIQQVWSTTWGGTYFAGTWWQGPKVPSQH